MSVAVEQSYSGGPTVIELVKEAVAPPTASESIENSKVCTLIVASVFSLMM